ncbi:beta strand repeat-containing protein [Streptomyces sp. NPDC090052]|uniref:beta strand repeat-containing protein n=1 Tax=Streptomyces sp. NPDC090052 TaxID=3365931 RepID=UPI00380C9FF1
MDIGTKIAQLEKRLEAMERSSRLSHASLDDTALQLHDGVGGLRGVVGKQGDGTTGVQIVNGPPPPQPSPPIAASVLGGVTVSWDGQFDGGAIIPMDWARLEVHASPTSGFAPDASTLQSTIETAQGATVVIPTENPVYVLLLSRNTSGAASTPTAQVGPLGPTPVVATDILDGIVTTLKLADDAVTSAKLAAAAVDTTAIADGAVLTEKLHDAAVSVGKLADGAVTGPAIAASAVTAGKIDADAVTAREIAAGSVTASEVAAGAITADKLTITGSTNILADPSFEGPASVAMVAGVAYWSIDSTKGNGSASSLKVDATASSATNRTLTIATIPVIPGDQLYLASDYQASTDYNGTRVRFYARWHDASGATLGYATADSGTPVLGPTWQRITISGTAPASATRADIVTLAFTASVGTVWFDNSVVRSIVGGTEIQDGAISTQKIVAGAVQTAQLDTGAVNADKIAAGAVTTTKLDALAVTADKIAANTITAGQIAAGAVDATALNATAITGKTITGGTINGAEFHSNNSAGATVDIEDGKATFTAANGWEIIVDPTGATNDQPVLFFKNGSGIEAGTINASGDNSRAGLSIASGPFTDGAITDYRWGQVLGQDPTGVNGWGISRTRDSDLSVIDGGLFNADGATTQMGVANTADATVQTVIQVEKGVVLMDQGRLYVNTRPSTNPAFRVDVTTAGQTGYLMHIQREGSVKLTLDKDGKLGVLSDITSLGTVSGSTLATTGTVSGATVTATGTVSGDQLAIANTTWTTWSPSFTGGGSATFSTRTGWYYQLGGLIYVDAYIVIGTAGTGSTAVGLSVPVLPYRSGSRQNLPGAVHDGSVAGAGPITAMTLAGGSTAVFDRVINSAGTDVTGALLTAGSIWTFQGWYRV